MNALVRRTAEDMEEIYAYRNMRFALVPTRGRSTARMNPSLAGSVVANLREECVRPRRRRRRDRRYAWRSAVASRSANSGAGGPLDAGRIFDRFYQGAKKEGSTGLGLAVVDAVCRLYGLKVVILPCGRAALLRGGFPGVKNPVFFSFFPIFSDSFQFRAATLQYENPIKPVKTQTIMKKFTILLRFAGRHGLFGSPLSPVKTGSSPSANFPPLRNSSSRPTSQAVEVSYAKVDEELFDKDYKVVFVNGSKVEFAKDGAVDGGRLQVRRGARGHRSAADPRPCGQGLRRPQDRLDRPRQARLGGGARQRPRPEIRPAVPPDRGRRLIRIPLKTIRRRPNSYPDAVLFYIYNISAIAI